MDNKDPNSPDAPKGNVMDVQPPTPQPSASPAPSAPVVSGSSPASTEAPTPEVPAPAPTEPSLADETPEVKSGGLSPELLAKAEAEFKGPETKGDGKPVAAHPSHKGHKPVLVIVIAVVVALALAGAAVYAYMQSKDTDTMEHNDQNTTHESSNTDTTQPATAKDVEAAAKELDNTVNATNEAQEIPDSGLNESAVGL
jgi:uncharacterized protein HemX